MQRTLAAVNVIILLRFSICNGKANLFGITISTPKRDHQSYDFAGSIISSLPINKKKADTYHNDVTATARPDQQAMKLKNVIQPPPHLESLALGEVYHLPQQSPSLVTTTTSSNSGCGNITAPFIVKLSTKPNIFLIRNTLSTKECNDLIFLSREKRERESCNDSFDGIMERAKATKFNFLGGYRTNSYVSWLVQPSIREKSSTVKKSYETVRKLTQLGSNVFLRNKAIASCLDCEELYDMDDDMVVECEPIQLLRYIPSGKFGIHHDGYGRFVTILTYLNGVGGTWFPYAATTDDLSSFKRKNKLKPGQDGLLIVGNEVDNDQHTSDHSLDRLIYRNKNNRKVVRVFPGDSIVCYNYNLVCGAGSKRRLKSDTAVGRNNDELVKVAVDWKSVHCGLKTSKEKWVATNWYRCRQLQYHIDKQNKDHTLTYITTAIQSFFKTCRIVQQCAY